MKLISMYFVEASTVLIYNIHINTVLVIITVINDNYIYMLMQSMRKCYSLSVP